MFISYVVYLLTDEGVVALTEMQTDLVVLELRKQLNLTSNGLQQVASPKLERVDLRGCTAMTSEGGVFSM